MRRSQASRGAVALPLAAVPQAQEDLLRHVGDVLVFPVDPPEVLPDIGAIAFVHRDDTAGVSGVHGAGGGCSAMQ